MHISQEILWRTAKDLSDSGDAYDAYNVVCSALEVGATMCIHICGHALIWYGKNLEEKVKLKLG